MSYSSLGYVSGTGRMTGCTEQGARTAQHCSCSPAHSPHPRVGKRKVFPISSPTADELPPLHHFNALQAGLPFPVSLPLLSCCRFQHLGCQMFCGRKATRLVHCCLCTGLWKYLILSCLVVGALLAIARLIWNENLSELPKCLSAASLFNKALTPPTHTHSLFYVLIRYKCCPLVILQDKNQLCLGNLLYWSFWWELLGVCEMSTERHGGPSCSFPWHPYWAQAVYLSADVFLCMLIQHKIKQDLGLKYLY